MLKKLTFIFISVVIIVVSFNYYNANHKNTVTRKQYKAMIDNHPISKDLRLSKTERKKQGIPPNKYFDEQYLLEMNPFTGEVHPENMERIKAVMRRNKKFALVPGFNEEMSWQERGPDNIAGRTRVAFFDPNDVNNKRVIAGGVSGGLWSISDITNENLEWTQIGIDENLSVSSYAIDPNNSNIWYVGTGESFTGDDGTGNGLWKTTNGGVTWEKVFAVSLNTDIDFRPYFINEVLAWNNNGSTEIFISIDGGRDVDFVGVRKSGWWRSTDGGNNFTQIDLTIPGVNPSSIDQYVFSDVEVDANNDIWAATKKNIAGFGGGKIFKSIDGFTFTEKYSFEDGDRTELTISKQDPKKIFAICEVPIGVDFIKTSDDFENVSPMAKPNDRDNDISTKDFARDQAFYNLVIEVDPNDDNILYAGGINLFRSDDAGGSWTQISRWILGRGLESLNVPLIHADQHVVTFHPDDSNRAVIGNDGGIYYASDLKGSSSSTTAIQGRKKGLNITQFYSVANFKSGTTEILLGGTQDNGSLLVDNNPDPNIFEFAKSGMNSFTDIFGGDGIMNFIDKNGDYLIVSFIGNVYSLLPLREEDPQFITIANDQNTGDFANEADLDDNLDILYTNGSNTSNSRVSRYSNITTNSIRQNFTNATMTGDPTAIKVSPHTRGSSTVFIGTGVGEIIKVTNFNTSEPQWEALNVRTVNGRTELTTDVGAISDIDVGANENEIYVTLHNYGVNNIYYTNDGGRNWVEKDGNYPDIPVKAIKGNPLNNNQVIIGTNMGVWACNNFNDNNPIWALSINGMSSVRVTHFDYREIDNVVAAATYGRGLFTGEFSSRDIAPNKIEVTLNNNISNGKLNIVPTSHEGDAQVRLIDINGQLVLSQDVSFILDENVEIDINVDSGIYILQIALRGIVTSKKVLLINN